MTDNDNTSSHSRSPMFIIDLLDSQEPSNANPCELPPSSLETDDDRNDPESHAEDFAESEHFYCVRGTDGCDHTFDVFSKKTGECIASLPYWQQYEATRSATLLFMTALDRFIERGGFLKRDAISRALAAEYTLWSGTGELIGTFSREDD